MKSQKIKEFIQSGAILSLRDKSLIIGYGPYEWKDFSELQDDLPAFYFPDFFLTTSKPWLQFAKWLKCTPAELRQELGKSENKSHPAQWHSPHQDIFYHSFDKLQQDFASSQLHKAVPYVFAYTPSSMLSERLCHSLRNALEYIEHYPGYIYGFWLQNEGMIGVTPELLFTYQPPTLHTMALAGTSSKQKCAIAFRTDPKEQKEHRLVIEFLQQSLKPFGKVTTGGTQVLELSTLNHLMTPIQVELNGDINLEGLVRVLHPTPALGAFPREAGWKWLQNYQKQINRRRYGAPVGCSYSQQNILHCVVAIRNVQWDKEGMKIGAGCGVIKESICDQEWKEVCLKMRSIQELLAL